MTMISRTVSDVSDVILQYTDASGTLSAGGGNSMRFFAMGAARKGEPNKVHLIDSNSWDKILGKPFHSREGIHAECLRHVAEAVIGGAGYFIRVMPSDAKYPMLNIQSTVTDGFNEVIKDTRSYGSEPMLSGTTIASIYMIDADNDATRSIDIQTADADEYGEGFYEVTLLNTDKSGEVTIVESHIISFEIGALDVNNASAFIEDKLSRVSTRLRAVVDLATINTFEAIETTQFEGGTNGDHSTLTADDYKEAIDLIIASDLEFQAIISAGCYEDSVLAELRNLADGMNISCYYDIEPNLPFAQAAARQKSLAMNSHFCNAYHLPYLANDPYYDGQALWGLSGFVFAAKAKGVSLKSPTGGWHYTPAGEDRATISRSGLVLIQGAGTADEEEFVKVRLNKLGKNSAGQLMIDDALTTRVRKDQLRFDNIVSTDNSIGRDYVKLAKSLKHEPDGVTRKGLTDGMTTIFEGYVASECLVKPRDPADGDMPWKLHVEQLESDLWKVSWDICVSGSARRIIGASRLLK